MDATVLARDAATPVGDIVLPPLVDLVPRTLVQVPLSAGGNDSLGVCALDRRGYIDCWGIGGQTLLAPLAVASPTYVSPHRLFEEAGFVEIATPSGYDAMCARRADGDVYCWGDYLGTTPVRVAGLPPISSMAGTSGACGLSVSGWVCWSFDSTGAVTHYPMPTSLTGTDAGTEVITRLNLSSARLPLGLTADGGVYVGLTEGGPYGFASRLLSWMDISLNSGFLQAASVGSLGEYNLYCALAGDGRVTCVYTDTDEAFAPWVVWTFGEVPPYFGGRGRPWQIPVASVILVAPAENYPGGMLLATADGSVIHVQLWNGELNRVMRLPAGSAPIRELVWTDFSVCARLSDWSIWCARHPDTNGAGDGDGFAAVGVAGPDGNPVDAPADAPVQVILP